MAILDRLTVLYFFRSLNLLLFITFNVYGVPCRFANRTPLYQSVSRHILANSLACSVVDCILSHSRCVCVCVCPGSKNFKLQVLTVSWIRRTTLHKPILSFYFGLDMSHRTMTCITLGGTLSFMKCIRYVPISLEPLCSSVLVHIKQ